MSNESIDYILHFFRRLQANNYDVLTIVTGPKGTGKSSSTIYLARRYNQLFGFMCPKCGAMFYKNSYDMKIVDGKSVFYIPEKVLNGKVQCPYKYKLNIKDNKKEIDSGCGHVFDYKDRKIPKWESKTFVCYDNKDIVDKIFSLPDYAPIVADEAVKAASAQNWNKSDAKELKDLFTVIRPRRFLMFFNLPEFTWLDHKYREGMSSFWLRIVDRGIAVLFEKDKGESKDKYHLKELEALMGTVKFFTSTEKVGAKLKKHPCYFDTLSIPMLPDNVYDDYELYRNAVNLQRQVEERTISNKDMAKIATFNLMHNWDRIKLAVDKSKEYATTYRILNDEIFVNPLTRAPLVSEATLRNWNNGVENFIKTQGQNALVFDGAIAKPEEKVDTTDAP